MNGQQRTWFSITSTSAHHASSRKWIPPRETFICLSITLQHSQLNKKVHEIVEYANTLRQEWCILIDINAYNISEFGLVCWKQFILWLKCYEGDIFLFLLSFQLCWDSSSSIVVIFWFNIECCILIETNIFIV